MEVYELAYKWKFLCLLLPKSGHKAPISK